MSGRPGESWSTSEEPEEEGEREEEEEEEEGLCCESLWRSSVEIPDDVDACGEESGEDSGGKCTVVLCAAPFFSLDCEIDGGATGCLCDSDEEDEEDEEDAADDDAKDDFRDTGTTPASLSAVEEFEAPIDQIESVTISRARGL